MILHILYTTHGTVVNAEEIRINGLTDKYEKYLVEVFKVVTATIAVTKYNLFNYKDFTSAVNDAISQIGLEYPSIGRLSKVLKKLEDNSLIIVLRSDTVPTLYEDFYRLVLSRMCKGDDFYKCWHDIFTNFGIAKTAIWRRYKINLFTDYGFKYHIGEQNTKLRKCRFCGITNPTFYKTPGKVVNYFQHISHAISQCIGNKNILSNEECDDCNKYFSEKIENDINNFFYITHALYSIKSPHSGKTKIAKGDNYSIVGKDVTVALPEGFTNFPAKIEVFPGEAGFGINLHDSNEYIPANVYRCLAKYAVSCIDQKYLPAFKYTTKWIRRKKRYLKLPFVFIQHNTPYTKTPILLVFTRKDTIIDMPFCVCMLSVYDKIIVYSIPYSDPYNHNIVKINSSLKRFVETYMKEENLHTMNLSSEKRTKATTSLVIGKNSPLNLTLVSKGNPTNKTD